MQGLELAVAGSNIDSAFMASGTAGGDKGAMFGTRSCRFHEVPSSFTLVRLRGGSGNPDIQSNIPQ